MARADDFDLAAALKQKNFTPSVKDVPALVELVAAGDDRAAAALVPFGDIARTRLIGAWRGDDAGPARFTDEGEAARLVQATGLFARKADSAAREALLGALHDPRVRVRRAAISGLAHLEGDDIRAALVARWDASPPADEKRALAEALGKLGGDEAIARLRALDPAGDAELARRRDRALVMTDRGALRGTESRVRVEVAPPSPVACVLHCKGGLADVLVNELRTLAIEAIAQRDDTVHLALHGPITTLFRSRLWITMGLRVPRPGGPLEPSIVDGIVGARKLFAALTDGPIRWRMDMPEGKQRAVVWRVARDVAAQASELVNDPADTTWDVRVVDDGLELGPRRMDDPRFAYRVADVPAASHPTVAAALARLAQPTGLERVWDPFCGSGLELIECARLAPEVRLSGTDLDAKALDAARANAAGLTIDLQKIDSRDVGGAGDLDLVITNPPLGSRVQVAAAPLLKAILPVIARRLVKKGRLVWITPAPRETAPVAEQLGLVQMHRSPIDLGGVRGQLERWVKR
ncbi:MAG: methyltransferase [Kofleriaceae bacterium]